MDNNQDPNQTGQSPDQPAELPQTPAPVQPGQPVPQSPAPAAPVQPEQTGTFSVENPEAPTPETLTPTEPVEPVPEPTVPPTTELPQPETTAPEDQMKSLEEISGIQSPTESSTEPQTEDQKAASKAEKYSKITRIALPIIVAVTIISVGYATYHLFLKGDSADTPSPEIGTDAPPSLNLTPPEDNSLKEDIPVNLDEEELEDALKDSVETEKTAPKAPSIKPKP